MENAIKDIFSFSYESGVTGSFLVVNASKDEKIIDFQVNMLAKNPNKHILPFDIRRNNDRVNLYYNITSKLSLSQYLKRSQLSKNEYIEIFSGIVKTLLSSKGYFLSDNSFLLDEDYIYISPDNMCISMVYLPVKLEIDIVKTLKEFAINFTVYSANISDENSDGFLQQFLNFLKKETFSIVEFDKFLKEMKRLVARQENDLKEPLEVQNIEKVPENKDKPHKKEENLKQEKPKIEIPKPKAVESRKNEAIVRKNEANERNNSIVSNLSAKPNVVIGAVIQGVIVIIILFLIFSGKLDSLGNDKVSTAFGILLVSGALSYFMWKNVLKINFPEKENKIANAAEIKKPEVKRPEVRKPEVKKPEVKNSDNKPKVNIPNLRSVEKPKTNNVQNEQKVSDAAKITPNENKNTEFVPSKITNVNETVLLSSPVIKHARLQIFKDSGIEEVMINKPSFIIGRLEGQVDYIHTNNAIGKVHAEIISREGCFYLKDLNSKNGTYINGKRIDSNKEYEIKNNDRLTLANSEFVFIVE